MADRTVCLTLPFYSNSSAALACDVLSVDKEVPRNEVRREITVEGKNLEITLRGTELKRLRVALNGVLKNIILIAKTIDQFKN